MNADALPSLKSLLEREGLWARKSLGQHFLLDLDLTRRIARAAGDLAGKTVIEIGPGPGGLTRALLEAGADPVIAVEKDPRFIAILAELIPWSDGRLRIIEGDASDVDEAALVDDALGAPIVANLPYNVGTALLVKWLKAGAWRGPMTLMFQLEVAERIVAAPGADAYGRLAVLAQAVTRARIVLRVPPRAFTPPPKVASAVVHLVDRADRFADLDALERVTAAAFGQRRKMLRSSFASLAGPASESLLTAAGIAPTERAEQVDVAAFCRLATLWRAHQSGGAQVSS
ncbi:MAG: 16S rRNA (adenine(1518)-N(6)/adenine(1519)-N(6))-dimethyltransferase RsmA [Hyphomonadaceae bacterium]|nr:MAG: 16S rRNA (adenine1518-N6/adenine1519-N6)-dimethyltransferase [Caulobacteraceae bacterium]MBT9445160.1 16S rRNA (adenine(1518)-N(6)/adenine(1519)-N(6))-dimethyltransferase RsmA [Hyphomonadaceae bacterium]